MDDTTQPTHVEPVAPMPDVGAPAPPDAERLRIEAMRASIPTPVVPDGAQVLSRAQLQAARANRPQETTPYYLEKTGSLALVRDLPFTDITMIMGIPAELRQRFDDALRNKALVSVAQGGGVQSLQDALDMYTQAEEMANAICIAAFVKPRLVMRESELDPADQSMWLVTDIDPEDRIGFMNWINRNRAAQATLTGGNVAEAAFQGPGVDGAASGAASDSLREATG